MELAGVPVISAGLIHPPADGYETYARRRAETCRRLVFHGSILVGFILVGEIEGAGVYAALIRERVDLGPWKEMLLEKGTCAPFVRGVRQFPERYAA